MSFLTYVLLVAQNLGLGKTYPWALLPLDLGRWIWAVATLALMVLIAEQAGFLRLGEGWQREAGLGWPRRDAIIVAALVHAAAIAALLIPWPSPFAPAPAPPPIPVSLVMEPPAPPAAQPKPPPQTTHDLESGPDQVTSAPPQAQAKGPEAAPKPQPEDEKAAVAEPPKTKPSPAAPQTARPKEAARETVPKPELGAVNRAPGDIDRMGDPYLNRLWALIESHRTYPANAIGSLGLRLEGTVTYLIQVSPTGALLAMRLERSSGANVLDDTARKMIEEAAPFPPLPGNFPSDGVVLSVTIHLFPEAS